MKFARKTLGLLSSFVVVAHLGCMPALANDGEGGGEAASSGSAESGWNTNFSESLDQAEKEHKLVLADFYTSWCGWCKRLDQTTFADPTFTQYLKEHYVAVKLNAEDHGEGQRTAEKNDVSAYPTGLVFAPNGKVVGRIFGYLNAPEYQAKLVKFAKKAPKAPKSH